VLDPKETKARDYAIDMMLRSGRYTGVRADLARTCFIKGWEERKEWFFAGAVPAPALQAVTLYQAMGRDDDGYPCELSAFFFTEEHARIHAAHWMKAMLDVLPDTERAAMFTAFEQVDKTFPDAGKCAGLPRMPLPVAREAVKTAQGYHLVPSTVLAVYRSPDPEDIERARALAKLTPRERALLGHTAEEIP